jgi:hypothetical protein
MDDYMHHARVNSTEEFTSEKFCGVCARVQNYYIYLTFTNI